jgi:hypothetical protein
MENLTTMFTKGLHNGHEGGKRRIVELLNGGIGDFFLFGFAFGL